MPRFREYLLRIRAGCHRRMLHINFIAELRPVRDAKRLARHFSAGTSKAPLNSSPIGTADLSPIYLSSYSTLYSLRKRSG